MRAAREFAQARQNSRLERRDIKAAVRGPVRLRVKRRQRHDRQRDHHNQGKEPREQTSAGGVVIRHTVTTGNLSNSSRYGLGIGPQ